MSDGLDAFLNKGEAGQASAAETQSTAAAEPTGEPQTSDQAVAPDSEATAEGEPPAPEGKSVPIGVVHAVRAERQDWKEKALRMEGEMAALKAQMEAAKVTPVPVAQPQQRQQETIPNPVEDPHGFVAYQQREFLNTKLDMSEAILRATDLPDIDPAIEAFKAATMKNPALGAEMARQQHPYKWAYDQGKRALAMAEIGDDPAAYRARIEAEIRSSLTQSPAPSVSSPAAPSRPLPRSLAGVPSSAPQAAGAWSGPTPFSEILSR